MWQFGPLGKHVAIFTVGATEPALAAKGGVPESLMHRNAGYETDESINS